jgi:hypothetical protein
MNQVIHDLARTPRFRTIPRIEPLIGQRIEQRGNNTRRALENRNRVIESELHFSSLRAHQDTLHRAHR